MTTDLLTLDQAAALIPGADAAALKRMVRAGKLTAFRPGKKYLTTAEHVLEAVREKCRVVPRVQDYTSAAPKATTRLGGSFETTAATAALDSALARLKTKKPKR